MEKLPISACIITYNEENKLRACLEAIKNYVDEIVVLDSFSTDKTVEIAGEYTNKIFFSKFSDYSDQHNKCTSLAMNEWVCNIEADEIFPSELWRAVRKAFEKGKHMKYNAFCFPRKTFFNERIVKNDKEYWEHMTSFDKEKDFYFHPKSFPNFIDRLHRKDLMFVGDIHPKLEVRGKRVFLPACVCHFPAPKTQAQTKERIERKKHKLAPATEAFYANKAEHLGRFFKDQWFYFNAMFFKLNFYKKGLRYWLFILRWFWQYYKLAFKILFRRSPHA
jgi:glycosyltransferase involved in cell wall biosynthesis